MNYCYFLVCVYMLFLPGSGAKLSCSPGRFEGLHWLHHRDRHSDEWGTGPCRCVAALIKGWNWADLLCFQTGWGSLLHNWDVWREGAEAVRVQHRHRQLPRGAHHPQLWLGWKGQVRKWNSNSCVSLPLVRPLRVRVLNKKSNQEIRSAPNLIAYFVQWQ